jgi:dihydropyrimidinase
MPGVETRLHLLWEGVTKNKISMNRFVEITSTAPAKIFGMYGKKGTLAVGADADVVVWDPNRAKTLGVKTLHMRIDYSPFEGRTVPGSPSHVLSRGDLIVKDDQWVGKTKKGRGQFVRRGTFNL